MSKSRKERQRRKRREQHVLSMLRRHLPGVAEERHHVVDSAELGLRKISECLLELVAPLLEPLGEDPDLDDAQAAMNLAVSVWNAVPMDERGTSYTARLSEKARVFQPGFAPLIDAMIEMRRTRFAGDPRIVVGFDFVRRDGRLALNASAVVPPPGAVAGVPGGEDA